MNVPRLTPAVLLLVAPLSVAVVTGVARSASACHLLEPCRVNSGRVHGGVSSAGW